MKRSLMRRRWVDTGPDRATLKELDLRSRGCCELCGDTATQTHHRTPRGMGSTRDRRINECSNLLRVCLDCHDYIETHRAEALIAGWLVSRYADPAWVNVLIQRGSRYVYLTVDGRYADDPPEVGAA